MKQLYFLLIGLLIGCAFVQGQSQVQIEYNYDDAGNRVKTTTIALKDANGPSLLDAQTGVIAEEELPEEYVEDYLSGSNVKIYPNPTRGELLLELKQFPEGEEGKASVYNLSGSLVLETYVGEGYNLLELTGKPEGQYILRLRIGTKEKVYQLIKQ